MKKKIQFSFKDNIIITVFIIFSLAYSITVATNFTFEPSYVSSNVGYFDKYKDKLNLTENIRGHREFLGGAAGDAIQYFAVALGKDDVSHPPYTTRLLLPKLAGFLAKSSFIFEKTDLINNDILFIRISLLNRFLNLLFCFLLVAIPFWVFRKIIFSKSCPISISILPVMNLVNIGVIMTAPFFMVDISLYVLFTFAAYFFFRQKTYKLFFVVCISLFAKEISMVLLVPLFYCVTKEKKINFYKKLLIIILPLFIYFFSRQIISGGFLELGQLRYNFLKDPFDFYYLKYHLNLQWGIFNFITRVVSSIGIIVIISFYMFNRFRVSQDKFLVVLFMLGLVIILNLLLASGVLRVSQVVTPFFIFYILYSYENIYKKLTHFRYRD